MHCTTQSPPALLQREGARPQIVVPPPGPAARAWWEFHHLHAPPSTYCYPFVWDVTLPAGGPFCHDPDGNLYLDFYAHVAAAPLGYNHPTILRECGVPFDPIKTAAHDTIIAVGPSPAAPAPLPLPHREAEHFRTPAHLQALLCELCAPFGFDAAFLVNSGAEANENAIKAALHRKWRMLRERLGGDLWEKLLRQLGVGRNPLLPGLFEDYPLFGIAFQGAFHGRTLGALSLSLSKEVHKEGFPTLRWVRHLPFNRAPLPVDLLIEETPLRELLAQGRLPQVVHEWRRIPRELLAFVILEPIQGEGGYVFAEPAFARAAERLARESDALLICDEIQTGLGRSGRWWASEHLGVRPDLLTLGKGLRVGAVVGRRRDFPPEPGVLSGTWSGGELAAAVGAATLEVIREENLLANARAMGARLLAGLEELAARHPELQRPRALGLLVAFDLPSREARGGLVERLFRAGLLTLGCGRESVRLLPPLDVRAREVDLALGILARALAGREGA
ncbi:MAG: aspartate aminotransferase family protein [Nitrospinota bacterium]